MLVPHSWRCAYVRDRRLQQLDAGSRVQCTSIGVPGTRVPGDPGTRNPQEVLCQFPCRRRRSFLGNTSCTRVLVPEFAPPAFVGLCGSCRRAEWKRLFSTQSRRFSHQSLCPRKSYPNSSRTNLHSFCLRWATAHSLPFVLCCTQFHRL